jgi:hypothetical protein
MSKKTISVTVNTYHQNPRHNQEKKYDNVRDGIDALINTYAGEDKSEPTGVSTLKIEGGAYRGHTYARWSWHNTRRSQIEWS